MSQSAESLSSRGVVPPTTTLQKELDIAESKLDAVLLQDTDSLKSVEVLTEASRSLRATWRVYSEVCMQLIKKLRKNAATNEAIELTKSLEAKRKAYMADMDTITAMRTSLGDEAITESDLQSTTGGSPYANLENMTEMSGKERVTDLFINKNPTEVEPTPGASALDGNICQPSGSGTVRFQLPEPPILNNTTSGRAVNTTIPHTSAFASMSQQFHAGLATSAHTSCQAGVLAQPSHHCHHNCPTCTTVASQTFIPSSANLGMTFRQSFPQPLTPQSVLTGAVYSSNNTLPIYSTLNNPISSSRNPLPTSRFNPSASAFMPADSQPENHCPRPKVENPFKTSDETYFAETDSTAKFLLRRELGSKNIAPFTGEPSTFHTWVGRMRRIIEDLGMTAERIVDLLESHTEGEPHSIIRNHRVTMGLSPQKTLDAIWHELNEEYGTANSIANELEMKVEFFPPIKSADNVSSLKDLLRLCRVIQSNQEAVPSLIMFNNMHGLKKLHSRLPVRLQDRMTREFATKRHEGRLINLQTFIELLERTIRQCRLSAEFKQTSSTKTYGTLLTATQRQVDYGQTADWTQTRKTAKPTVPYNCIVHQVTTHNTGECKVFGAKSQEEKTDLIRKHNVCFRCLGPHFKKHCQVEVSCDICQGNHISAMHHGKPKPQVFEFGRPENSPSNTDNTPPTNPVGEAEVSLCTTVPKFHSLGRGNKEASKVLLADIWCHSSSKKVRIYALLDEMSSVSFIAPELVEMLGTDGPTIDYNLNTMEGLSSPKTGKKILGLVLQGIGESKSYMLPRAYTHSAIPDCKTEIATPEDVAAYPHLQKYAAKFNPVDQAARVMLLIGRDGGHLMTTKAYGSHPPHVHHTSLGWAMISSSYTGDEVEFTTLRTSVNSEHLSASLTFPSHTTKGKIPENNTFARLPDDEEPGLSVQDRKFLTIMGDGVKVSGEGFLQMPLPFKKDNPVLPDNHLAVFKRTLNTLTRLKGDPVKLQQCLDTMKKYMVANQVETVPRDQLTPAAPGKSWFLPVFPVIHPKKGKYRLVFDSSAEFKGVSLNSELLQGPDRNNALKGVLLRFRNGPIAAAADVESMFHSFQLPVEDRDYLRFYWYRDNDPDNKLVQMRARVHIFGNTASPAVANFGMQFAANHPNSAQFPGGKEFILDRFYIDDGLASADSDEAAIDIIQGARSILGTFNIRLHKIISNSYNVLKAFPPSECAMPTTMEFGEQSIQHALGLAWNVAEDTLTFRTELPNRPFTKRGIVSIVNTLFDPLGICSPITLAGRILQRRIIADGGESKDNSVLGWDEPLPATHKEQWDKWQRSLPEVKSITLPRSYYPKSFPPVHKQELHVFADASMDAIGYVIYVRSINKKGEIHVSFVTGGSKLAPKATTSIPRLELCAAVEASNAATEVRGQLRMSPDQCSLYSDSLITLGYLRNSTKRFSKYVSRRVELILNATQGSEWLYVRTHENPADIATRQHTPAALADTMWLDGPQFLREKNCRTNNLEELFLNPDELPELDHTVLHVSSCHVEGKYSTLDKNRQELQNKTQVRDEHPFHRASNSTSSWTRLVNVCKVIQAVRHALDLARQKLKISLAPRPPLSFINHLSVSKDVLRQTQDDLLTDRDIKDKHIVQLNPYRDCDGLLRVGGRLKYSCLPLDGRNPVILPKNCRVGVLLIGFFHSKVRHQGRSVTLAATRTAGYHIVGARGTVEGVISSCTTCKLLRGRPLPLKMADFPADRLEESPPFTHTGVDIFGPYTITDGQSTRKSAATKKAWAAIFVCMVTRGVHLEMLPSMDTVSMQYAMRRFFSCRGVAKTIRSDNGTNLMAVRTLVKYNIKLENLQSEARRHECQWTTNPPGASHFNGAIERKIGSIRRIIDACLLQIGNRALTRDELSTFMQEAASIVNNTPLVPVSVHGNDPIPVSPANLLTLRDCPNPPPVDTFTQEDINAYGQKRWRRIQLIADNFWKRFRRQYLTTLQARKKWLKSNPSFVIDDVVLIAEKDAPRNSWPMGRVIATEKSHDGIARSCIVETAVGYGTPSGKRQYRRAANQLILIQPAGGRNVTAP